MIPALIRGQCNNADLSRTDDATKCIIIII